MSDSPIACLYDVYGNPLSSRPAAALASNQAGAVVLGSDYGANGAKAQVPKVDATGNVATFPLSAQQTGTALPSAAGAYGSLMLALQALTPQALQMDALGNVAALPSQQPTFAVNAPGVANASGKSLLALMNKSTSSVLRLIAVYAQNSGTNPSTLTAYAIFAEQLTFITGMSGGTSLSPVSHDTADVLASGITCATGASVSGEMTPALRRWITSTYPLQPGASAAEDTTADQQGREPWVSRIDPTAKPITIRPGYGVHVSAPSSGSTGGQTLTFVFTQSAA